MDGLFLFTSDKADQSWTADLVNRLVADLLYHSVLRWSEEHFGLNREILVFLTGKEQK